MSTRRAIYHQKIVRASNGKRKVNKEAGYKVSTKVMFRRKSEWPVKWRFVNWNTQRYREVKH